MVWTLPVALVAVIASLLQANITYQLYPTVGTLDPLSGPEELAYADIGRRAPRDGGVLTSVHLDNPASGFAARDAQVYLPPAYFAHPRPKLPVVVLVSGVPGSPEQWFAEGRAGQALDAFAEDHRGLAPITVAVDANGAVFKDTLCVDSPATGDKVMTYLAEDVPAGVAKLFDVDENPAETVATYFRGDRKAYDAIDPLKILETARFGGGAHGRIIAGLDDAEDREAGRELTAAAHAAGIDVAYSETPGAHTWRAWAAGFAESLPWLSARLGLTGEDS